MHTFHLTETPTDRVASKAFEAVVAGVAKSKKAVLLVGAGISTNAGIADFRSKGTGLYSSSFVSTSTLKGPELFSAAVYRSPETTAEHLRFIAGFKASLDSITSSSSSSSHPTASTSSSTPTPEPLTKTHSFLSTLKKRSQLLRVYTQNIDGLEGVNTGLSAFPLAGLTPCSSSSSLTAAKEKGKGKAKPEGDFVQLHGSVQAVRCTGCEFVREWTDEDGETFARGEVGSCPQCEKRATIRSIRGQRPLSSLQRAFLRPSITLYDESPVAALTLGSLSLSDLSSNPDCMIVMGTSLKIPGFKKLVKEFAKAVKARGGVRVLVNREEIGGKAEWKDVFDYQVVADTDSFVTRVLDDWKKTRPRDWAGKQATLGGMFGAGTTTKKGLLAGTAKPRQPLSFISPNSPSTFSSHAALASSPFSNLPSLPPLDSKKRLLPPASSSSSSSSPASPAFDLIFPSTKRQRLSNDTPAMKPAQKDEQEQSTPTKQRRTTRSLSSALRAAPPAPSFAAQPPRSPSAPRALRPPSLSLASPHSPLFVVGQTFFNRPFNKSEEYIATRVATPLVPPRSDGRGERTPSPTPSAGDGVREGSLVSPDLW